MIESWASAYAVKPIARIHLEATVHVLTLLALMASCGSQLSQLKFTYERTTADMHIPNHTLVMLDDGIYLIQFVLIFRSPSSPAQLSSAPASTDN